MKKITSNQHPIVKRACQLRLDRQTREQEMRALIAGRKLIHDLFSKISLEILFFHGEPPDIAALEKIEVSPEILKKIAGFSEQDGWAAIVSLPPTQSLVSQEHILILDQVSDPGNLGTLWRTALALGWDGIWLTPGCVDPFNDKALRAAQGSTFILPYDHVLPEQIIDWVKSKRSTLWVADLQGTPLDQCKIQSPLALLLGNEGQGPSEWTQSVGQRVTIPMNNFESLNVASAGAILLHAMRAKR